MLLAVFFLGFGLITPLRNLGLIPKESFSIPLFGQKESFSAGEAYTFFFGVPPPILIGFIMCIISAFISILAFVPDCGRKRGHVDSMHMASGQRRETTSAMPGSLKMCSLLATVLAVVYVVINVVYPEFEGKLDFSGFF